MDRVFGLIDLPFAGAGLWALAFCVILVWLLRRRQVAQRADVILDGSNVMYWRGDGPDLDTVRDVLAALGARGLKPGVIFDANAGYLLSDRYRHDAWFARQLDLPVSRIMVVPKGTPADPTILKAARDRGARIVTNDRYRDWAEAHPEIATPGHLVRGSYRKAGLHLGLD